MAINVDNTKVKDDSVIAALKGVGNKALDEMWNSMWVKDALGGGDELVEEVHKMAEKIRYQSDLVFVVASGMTAAMINGALTALVAEQSRTEFLIVGESLSAADFVQYINKAKNRKLSVMVISAGEDQLAERAAYVCAKKLLVDEYGEANALSRIHMVLNRDSGYFVEEASANGIEIISLPDGIEPACAADTAAMLLPIMTAGIDGEDYVKGFRDMLADTWWDADAMDYSLYLADHCSKNGKKENILTGQQELTGLADWLRLMHENIGIDTRKIVISGGEKINSEADYETVIEMTSEAADVVLPSFPGCNEDGSVNLLLKEQIQKFFDGEKFDKRCSRINTEELKPYDFARLMAFLQVSCGITSFIFEN